MANAMIKTGDFVKFSTSRRPGQFLCGVTQLGRGAMGAGIHLIEGGKLMIFNLDECAIYDRITEAEYLGKESFAMVTAIE